MHVKMGIAIDSQTKPTYRDIEKYYFSIASGIVFFLSLVTNWYFLLSLMLFTLAVLAVLAKLGKGIVLRELIALYSIFIYLVMAILGYTVYSRDNALAKLWLRYMPVPAELYFGFALPATAAFSFILCWPIDTKGISDEGQGINTLIDRCRQKLQEFPKISIYIILTGIVMYYIGSFLPTSLQFIATLFFWSSFAGILYLYYTSNFKHRWIWLLLFLVFNVVNAIQGGMFTIVAYMGITIFSFFFVGKKTVYWKKLLIFTVGAFLLILIQNVKQTYRKTIWNRTYEGNKLLLFSNVIVDKLNSTTTFFETEAFFPIYYRTNQGINVALVMRRFPNNQPFDNGKNLMQTLAASLVPRLLWPDKPEAGGKQNMLYYAGATIRNYSTNVGPLGEAYGSFGNIGGVIYMFVLGAFIRWSYKRVFIISKKIPLILFWIPVMFYQITYSAESDTLQILNSLFKSAFFVWLVVVILPQWFGIIKDGVYKKIEQASSVQ
jgi:hypothetical protein